METQKRFKFDSTVKHVLFNSDTRFSVTNSNDVTTLEGYALKWNELSSDRGGYFVKLLPNSAQFLTPTFALINHDYDQVLARNDDNSLRITSDQIGVKVQIDLPQTSYAKDLEWLVANKKIRGMSFAMLPGGDYEESSVDGKDIVSFSKFAADEVTITPIPAFDQTSIAVQQNNEPQVQLKLSAKQKEELDRERLKLEEYKVKAYSL